MVHKTLPCVKANRWNYRSGNYSSGELADYRATFFLGLLPGQVPDVCAGARALGMGVRGGTLGVAEVANDRIPQAVQLRINMHSQSGWECSLVTEHLLFPRHLEGRKAGRQANEQELQKSWTTAPCALLEGFIPMQSWQEQNVQFL